MLIRRRSHPMSWSIVLSFAGCFLPPPGGRGRGIPPEAGQRGRSSPTLSCRESGVTHHATHSRVVYCSRKANTESNLREAKREKSPNPLYPPTIRCTEEEVIVNPKRRRVGGGTQNENHRGRFPKCIASPVRQICRPRPDGLGYVRQSSVRDQPWPRAWNGFHVCPVKQP